MCLEMLSIYRMYRETKRVLAHFPTLILLALPRHNPPPCCCTVRVAILISHHITLLVFKWARIPSLRNLDTSGRSMSSSAGISGMKGRTTSTVGVGGGSMKPALGNEADLARSVKYVLDLFIAAYFQFDTTVSKTLCSIV